MYNLNFRLYPRDPKCKMAYVQSLFIAVLFATANDQK